MKISQIFVIFLVLLTAACEHTTIRQHPNFAENWNKQYSLAILPPEAHIEYVQFDSDNHRMKDGENTAIRLMESEAPKIFRAQGYKVISADFNRLFQEEPELKFELEKIRQSTNAQLQELYERNPLPPEKAFAFRKSVGPLVNIFADYANVDILVYMKYVGYEKSDGLIAKDVLAGLLLGGVSPSEAGAIEAVFLDGTTGDILWTNGAATAYPLNKYDPSKEHDSSLFSSSSKRAFTPLGVVFEELPNKTRAKPSN